MAHIAYVDGSYLYGKVGYGAILLKDDNVVAEFSGEVTHDTDSRQVTGELVATMKVLQYCQDNNIPQVEIIYDYKGIAEWATGGWKANKTLTQNYAAFVKKSPVKVKWTKVKSHSGDKWNDRADELAKQGTGITQGTSVQNQAVVGDTALLAAIGEAFAAHLNDKGYQAQFDDVKNNQYARISIYNGKKRLGFFDLYNTKNRPLDPYLHGFSDKKLVSEIETLWIVYKMQL
jgi:ribonuclease HI